jgi:hypothetical protein
MGPFPAIDPSHHAFHPQDGSVSVQPYVQEPQLLASLPTSSPRDSDINFESSESRSSSTSATVSTDSVDIVESLPSEMRDESLSRDPRPACPHPQCGKDFSSITNLNKHIKFDCRWTQKARFCCRNFGCKKHFSREAYRLKHEKTACKLSQSTISRLGYATGI